MSSIEDMISQFNEMGIIKKIIVGCCAVYLILMIITLLGHALLGIPLDSYTEESPTKYIDFADLDIDGDGGLSFDEVRYYDHNSEFSISDSELYTIFERCDKNGNGLLIGGEYDYYVASVKNHLSDLKAQKEKAQREAKERAKKSSSSSSSSSSHLDWIWNSRIQHIYNRYQRNKSPHFHSLDMFQHHHNYHNCLKNYDLN